MKVSNCCGASMNSMWLDYEMCPDCHDHCEAVEEYEEEIDIPGFEGTIKKLNDLHI